MGPNAAALTSQTDPAPLPAQDTRRSRTEEARTDPGATPPPALRRGILTQAVERVVIPRLLLARQTPPAAPPAITLAQVIELTDLTLAPDEAGVATFIAGLQAQGVPAETIYLHLLTASARRLGVFWVEDVCDFTQVTIGVGRLHNAMRALGPAFLAAQKKKKQEAQAGPDAGPSGGRVVLAPLPGEQHTFGLAMVADFFRRAGWSVRSGPVASRAELAAMLRAERVDVLGFSLACNEQLEQTRAEIAAAREASRNPAMAVMVGGPPFVAHPELATAVGADGTASDGLQAVAEAEALMRRTVERQAPQAPGRLTPGRR